MQSLPRRLSHCVLEGEPFVQGAEYISCLDLEENRKDYCPKCWEKIAKPVEGHFWKGRIPFKKEKVISPDAKALELFRIIEDPKKSFILALYLQRKQQIVRRTQTVYEIPETGEVFNVERVTLTSEEGAALSQELNDLLNHEYVLT